MPRPATVEQELVLLQRVTLVRSVAASSGYNARLCPDPYVCVQLLEPFLLFRLQSRILQKLTSVQGTTTESPATSVTPSLNKSFQGRRNTRSNIRTRLCELSSPPSSPPSSLESLQSSHHNTTRRLRGTAQRPAALDLMGVSLMSPFISLQWGYAEHLLDTQWGHGGCGSALNGARDVVSVVALTKKSCPFTVSIGEHCWTFQAGTTSSVSYYEVQFDSTMTGPVRISLDGSTTEGPAIVNECSHGQVSL